MHITDNHHKSVWRPLHGVVQDWPLAVMDYQSIKDSEIHPTNIFKERSDLQGQTVSISHASDQKWYYLDKQDPTEVTFIKIWDNHEGVAKSQSDQAVNPEGGVLANDCFQCVHTVHFDILMCRLMCHHGKALRSVAWCFITINLTSDWLIHIVKPVDVSLYSPAQRSPPCHLSDQYPLVCCEAARNMLGSILMTSRPYYSIPSPLPQIGACTRS